MLECGTLASRRIFFLAADELVSGHAIPLQEHGSFFPQSAASSRFLFVPQNFRRFCIKLCLTDGVYAINQCPWRSCVRYSLPACSMNQQHCRLNGRVPCTQHIGTYVPIVVSRVGALENEVSRQKHYTVTHVYENNTNPTPAALLHLQRSTLRNYLPGDKPTLEHPWYLCLRPQTG